MHESVIHLMTHVCTAHFSVIAEDCDYSQKHLGFILDSTCFETAGMNLFGKCGICSPIRSAIDARIPVEWTYVETSELNNRLCPRRSYMMYSILIRL